MSSHNEDKTWYLQQLKIKLLRIILLYHHFKEHKKSLKVKIISLQQHIQFFQFGHTSFSCNIYSFEEATSLVIALQKHRTVQNTCNATTMHNHYLLNCSLKILHFLMK